MSSGVLGLIDAIERYDPRPWGEVRDVRHARIRGPSSTGSESSTGCRARCGPEPARSSGRWPTGVAPRAARRPTTSSPTTWRSQDQLQQWLSAIASTTVGPLERALAAGAEPRALSGEVPIVPSTVVEESEVRPSMRAEIDKLPEREKLVLSLYYDEGLTLAQIGRVLGVSESRVPQIHTKSVLYLRARMAAAGVA